MQLHRDRLWARRVEELRGSDPLTRAAAVGHVWRLAESLADQLFDREGAILLIRRVIDDLEAADFRARSGDGSAAAVVDTIVSVSRALATARGEGRFRQLAKGRWRRVPMSGRHETDEGVRVAQLVRARLRGFSAEDALLIDLRRSRGWSLRATARVLGVPESEVEEREWALLQSIFERLHEAGLEGFERLPPKELTRLSFFHGDEDGLAQVEELIGRCQKDPELANQVRVLIRIDALLHSLAEDIPLDRPSPERLARLLHAPGDAPDSERVAIRLHLVLDERFRIELEVMKALTLPRVEAVPRTDDRAGTISRTHPLAAEQVSPGSRPPVLS